MKSGKKEQSLFLLAKTEEFPKLEHIAPITLATFVGIQEQELKSWVQPKRDLADYEQNQGQFRATVNACERIARFGFG
jgi:hypothetical protein